MKTLREALIKKHTPHLSTQSNPFRLTKKDMIKDLEGSPIGVVVRMLEEQEKQRNKPDVTVFQKNNGSNKCVGGFYWPWTEAGKKFGVML